MARIMTVIDDISGEAGADKRHFAVGVDAYEIDLTDEGWEELLAVLAPWVEKGTRTGKNQNVKGKSAEPAAAKSDGVHRHLPEEVTALRRWCTAHDVPLPPGGGRIAASIWRAFQHNDVSMVPESRRGRAA